MADGILRILQHALGRDDYGRAPRGEHRNHFCTGPGHANYGACLEGVAAGLMLRHPPSALSGGDDTFTVTEAGRAHVISNSPRPPVETRSQRRYRAWLEADTGMRFGDWLRARRETSHAE